MADTDMMEGKIETLEVKVAELETENASLKAATEPRPMSEALALLNRLRDDYRFECEAGSLSRCRDFTRLIDIVSSSIPDAGETEGNDA